MDFIVWWLSAKKGLDFIFPIKSDDCIVSFSLSHSTTTFTSDCKNRQRENSTMYIRSVDMSEEGTGRRRTLFEIDLNLIELNSDKHNIICWEK